MTNRIAAGNIKLKRVYEESAATDGTRVLVDRLWPRGLKKADAAIDRWMKDLAPSPELRRWFGHDPARWEEFRRRYSAEVRAHAELLQELRDLARSGPVTLLFAARDETHNEAVGAARPASGEALTRGFVKAPIDAGATASSANCPAPCPASAHATAL
jgi:uncharacterized protein YeaO (DUF488 family)